MDAFYDCSKLAEINCRAKTPPTANWFAFSNYNAVLNVPIGTAELYRSANEDCWPKFTTINEKDFEASGIEEILISEDNKDIDIYNLNGVCIKRNATEDDINSLAPGLYVVGGKKVFVK